MDFILILAIILLLIWILYDLGKWIYAKLTYEQVMGELIGYTYIPRQGSDDRSSYTLRIRYSYEGKESIYETKYSISSFVPKQGSQQKVYVNKNNKKVYFVHYPTFLSFLFFRILFLIIFIVRFSML